MVPENMDPVKWKPDWRWSRLCSFRSHLGSAQPPTGAQDTRSELANIIKLENDSQLVSVVSGATLTAGQPTAAGRRCMAEDQ